ncbi:MAG: glycoside hydrolase family 140 protein [Verrucomicrobia bacterium]|nr:glycoside hydrolase family 140 protein [Verrucomicrobiota bacterium]
MLAGFPSAGLASAPLLKVSPNKRFLVKEDGSPFFYLGDTAWELFHRLNRDETDFYLSNRVDKGFTVIQAVVLAEFDGLTVPNAYGHRPLRNNDPAKPDEAYFKDVDYVVNKAEALGLYVGMLPTWGDKWTKKWGVGPEIFTPANAEAYGRFLGRRYKDKPIIWILGGDRNPENDGHFAIIRALAKGLKQGDGGRHLVTYHPQGSGNSSKWFHGDAWLDFNMFQSGHASANIPNYRFTSTNYNLTPIKPTLDGEPRYEDHPINWKPANGWFDDWDTRQALYWSVLSGACGHTYGNHNIWQFWQPDRKPISSARTEWRKAIDQPGAFQMGYARKLLESRPYQKLVPDQSLLTGEPGEGAEYLCAASASDGSFGLVYTPMGKSFSLKVGKFVGSRIKAQWFDPRDGSLKLIGEFPTLGAQQFTPPSQGRGNDWLLVVDASTQKAGGPGIFPKP